MNKYMDATRHFLMGYDGEKVPVSEVLEHLGYGYDGLERPEADAEIADSLTRTGPDEYFFHEGYTAAVHAHGGEIASLKAKCDKLAGAVKDYDDFVRDLQKYTAKYIEPGNPQITDNEYILSMIGCLDGAKSRKLQSAEAVQIAREVHDD